MKESSDGSTGSIASKASPGFLLGKNVYVDEKIHSDVFLFCAALSPQNLYKLLTL